MIEFQKLKQISGRVEMRIRFKKSNLVYPASVVNSVAPSTSPTPILVNMLVRTEHDNLVSFLATDFETRVRVEVSAEVEERGSVLIPAKTFYDLVKELPEDAEVLLETSGAGARLQSASVKANLQTAPSADFPHFPQFEPDFRIDMNQADLKNLLNAVTFIVPTRDPRKIFLGCCFSFSGDTLQAVATDGKIMAMTKIPVEAEGIPAGRQAVIPRKMLVEMAYALQDEGTVTLELGPRQVGVNIGNTYFVSNLIDGAYPNWEKVVPQSFLKTLRFPRSPIMSAVRRAGVMMDIKSSTLKINFNGAGFVIESDSYDRGQLTENIIAENPLDEEYLIGLNYTYFNNVLKALNDDEVLMMCNEPVKPVIFTTAKNPDTQYLIMPVKINREVPVGSSAEAAQPGSGEDYNEDSDSYDNTAYNDEE